MTHHADKGGQYIRLYVTMLTDVDLLDAGDLAFLGAVKLLLWSRQHREDGLVPASTRKVQLIAQFDGGREAAQQSLDALLNIGFLVPTDDPEWLAVRSWNRYQSDLVAERAERSARTHRTNHKAGKHDGRTVEGCPDCGTRSPTAAPSVVRLPVPPAPTQKPSDLGKPVKRTGTLLRQEFVDAFPAVFDEVGDRLDGYRYLLDTAEELADNNAGLSKNLRGNLLNAVLEDALRYYIDGYDWSHEDIRACLSGAKALSADHGHMMWILAAQAGATTGFNSVKHAVGWLTTTAANKRRAYLEGTL